MDVHGWDWADDFPENTRPWDFVFASDVLWHKQFVPKFFEGLVKVTRPNMHVILAHSTRTFNLDELLRSEAIRCGFEVCSEVPSTSLALKPYGGHDMVTMWLFRRRDESPPDDRWGDLSYWASQREIQERKLKAEHSHQSLVCELESAPVQNEYVGGEFLGGEPFEGDHIADLES